MQRFSTGGLPQEWKDVVDPFLESREGGKLLSALEARLAAGVALYPPDPWRALRLAGPRDVRVVILGQDPYHGPGQACGLAFSVPAALRKLPPSLKNIFRELELEYGRAPRTGDLTAWAGQGVMLLNTVLTVEEGKAFSCAGLGWEILTDLLIARIAACPGPRVYMLWGAAAQKKETLIREAAGGEILVLRANHPSPLSARRPPAPFIGCGHFRRADEWLRERSITPISWT